MDLLVEWEAVRMVGRGCRSVDWLCRGWWPAALHSLYDWRGCERGDGWPPPQGHRYRWIAIVVEGGMCYGWW